MLGEARQGLAGLQTAEGRNRGSLPGSGISSGDSGTKAAGTKVVPRLPWGTGCIRRGLWRFGPQVLDGVGQTGLVVSGSLRLLGI